MKKIFECEMSKKAELSTILEKDPYADDSFARIGYKLKDGAFVGGDKNKLYLYISASEEFLKKAAERLKDIAIEITGERAESIIKAIEEEEEAAEGGFGAIFG